MDTPQKTAHPFQLIQIVYLVLPAPHAGEQGKEKAAVRMQRSALQRQRRHRRDLCAGQIQSELMFLTDLCGAPALRAVKLHHVAPAIFVHKLIDAVLVTVQRREAGIDAQANSF